MKYIGIGMWEEILEYDDRVMMFLHKKIGRTSKIFQNLVEYFCEFDQAKD
jgi:hypothetical protein